MGKKLLARSVFNKTWPLSCPIESQPQMKGFLWNLLPEGVRVPTWRSISKFFKKNCKPIEGLPPLPWCKPNPESGSWLSYFLTGLLAIIIFIMVQAVWQKWKRSQAIKALNNNHYSVFISHAGPFKTTLAIPLARKFKKMGIAAFCDEESLRPLRGSAVHAMNKALRSAKVVIILIDTFHFLSSKWCLWELKMALERDREGDNTFCVFPVFLNKLCEYPRVPEDLHNCPTNWDKELVFDLVQEICRMTGMRSAEDRAFSDVHVALSVQNFLREGTSLNLLEAIEAENRLISGNATTISFHWFSNVGKGVKSMISEPYETIKQGIKVLFKPSESRRA